MQKHWGIFLGMLKKVGKKKKKKKKKSSEAT